MTVYICTTSPWGGFPSSIARQPKEGANTERYVCTYSGSSRRDISNPKLLGTDTNPTVEMSRMENRPMGVYYTPSPSPSYTVRVLIPGSRVQQCRTPEKKRESWSRLDFLLENGCILHSIQYIDSRIYYFIAISACLSYFLVFLLMVYVSFLY